MVVSRLGVTIRYEGKACERLLDAVILLLGTKRPSVDVVERSYQRSYYMLLKAGEALVDVNHNCETNECELLVDIPRDGLDSARRLIEEVLSIVGGSPEIVVNYDDSYEDAVDSALTNFVRGAEPIILRCRIALGLGPALIEKHDAGSVHIYPRDSVTGQFVEVVRRIVEVVHSCVY